MIDKIIKWYYGLFEEKFKKVIIVDVFMNKEYHLEKAKLIKKWKEDSFYGDYIKYWAYLLEDGTVFVYYEEWFIQLEDTGTSKYNSIDEFYEAYFPEREIIRL